MQRDLQVTPPCKYAANLLQICAHFVHRCPPFDVRKVQSVNNGEVSYSRVDSSQSWQYTKIVLILGAYKERN